MTTLSVQVAASADDAQVRYDGAVWQFSLVAVANRIGNIDGTHKRYGCGLRFANNITIPQGSTVNSCVIRFVPDGDYSENTVRCKIWGDKISDAPAFSTLADYEERFGTPVGEKTGRKTTAYVTWDTVGIWQNLISTTSPDISTILQELIDQPTWISGNAVVLYVEDHDDLSTGGAYRQAYSFDASVIAPYLDITYTAPVPAGQTLSPDSIDLTATFGTPKVNREIVASSIELTGTFGSPSLVLESQDQTISPSSIELTGSFGTPQLQKGGLLMIAPKITVTVVGYVPSPILGVSLYAPRALADAIAYAPSFLKVSLIAPLARIRGLTSFYHILHLGQQHNILKGEFSIPTLENRVYVVGGGMNQVSVYGEALSQDEIDAVGEILLIMIEQSIILQDHIDLVAASLLSKLRLMRSYGTMTVPVNCGQELWDVINIDQDIVNQDANYRVRGKRMVWKPLEVSSKIGDHPYSHTFDLTAV